MQRWNINKTDVINNKGKDRIYCDMEVILEEKR